MWVTNIREPKVKTKWLMERLGTPITRRHQYLWYRKEHQKKMEQIHTFKKDAEGKTIWSGEKASTYFPNDTLAENPIMALQSIDIDLSKTSQPPRTEYADSSKGKDGASELLRTPYYQKTPMRTMFNRTNISNVLPTGNPKMYRIRTRGSNIPSLNSIP